MTLQLPKKRSPETTEALYELPTLLVLCSDLDLIYVEIAWKRSPLGYMTLGGNTFSEKLDFFLNKDFLLSVRFEELQEKNLE